LCIRDRRCHT